MGNGTYGQCGHGGQWGTGVWGILAVSPTRGMGSRGMAHMGISSTGVMGYKGYWVQGVWVTWAMGYMGNGAHGPWGLWAMGPMGPWVIWTFLPITSLILNGFLQKFYWTYISKYSI